MKYRFEALEPRQMLTVHAVLIQDLNTQPAQSLEVSESAAFGDGVVFAASRSGGPEALWFADSNEDQVSLVAPDGISSFRNLIATEQFLYFEFGDDLYRTDGTVDGTKVISQDGLASQHSDRRWFTAVGPTLYFSAVQDPTGRELWKSDGTVGGTQLVRDIRPDASASPNNLVAYQDKLFFSAVHEEFGAGIWSSDGTAEGTIFVKDARAEFFSSDGPEQLTVVGESLYYVAANDTEGYRLWTSDGSTVGTQPVQDFEATAKPSELTAFDGRLFFVSADSRGVELWNSNGTAEGTRPFLDIEPGPEGSYPHQLTAGGRLYFRAQTQQTGAELWSTDGTIDGTQMARNISRNDDSTEINQMTPIGDLLYFRVRGSSQFLWVSDGTLEGTNRLTSGVTNRLPDFLTASGDTLYYFATTREQVGFWRVSKDMSTFLGGPLLGTQSSSISESKVAGEHYFFVVEDELWATHTGTLETGPVTSQEGRFTASHSLVSSGGVLYFVASSSGNGAELWKSDGTAGGTNMVLNINRSFGEGSFIRNLQPFQDGVLFTSQVNGIRTPWVSLGTEDTTLMFTNKHIGSASDVIGVVRPGCLCDEERIYFQIIEDRTTSLWTSDGSVAGTRRIKALSEGIVAEPRYFTKSGAFTYFYANTREFGREIWRTDNTEAGTEIVRDLNPEFGGGSDIRDLVDLGNGILLFVVRRGDNRGLWRTDGTADGTVEIRLPDVEHDYNIHALLAYQERVYFSATHPQKGAELWVTDGTYAGTLVFDISPGPMDSSPEQLKIVNGHLHFIVRAFDSRGTHIGWFIHGAMAAPQRFADFPYTELPEGDGTSVFFLAGDEAFGFEPRVYQPTPGDANFDGQVNFADFLRLSANFGERGTWAEGDFDGDNAITFADFLLLSSNFRSDAQPKQANLASDVVDAVFAA